MMMVPSPGQMIHLTDTTSRIRSLGLCLLGAFVAWGWAAPGLAQTSTSSSHRRVVYLSAGANGQLDISRARFGPHAGRGARNFWAQLEVSKKTDADQILYVDPGPLLVSPDGVEFAPIPHQRILLTRPRQQVNLELLPFRPEQPLPKADTPLTMSATRDLGALAVLSAVALIEGEDARRFVRYVEERGGVMEVDTIVDNQDVTVARWMSWDRGPDGRIRGRMPRDAIRFALFAATAGYTIQEMTDWLRVHRGLKLKPGAEAAWRLSRPVEHLLGRAGLNYRVFSPRYADFHYNQGIKAYLAEDLEAAVGAFKDAVSLKSDYVDAQYNLGVTYYRMGNFKKAQEAFLVASGMGKPRADVLYNRGASLYRAGDRLGAARAFRAALQAEPGDEQARAWLQKADPEGKTAPKKRRKRRRRRRKRRRRR